MNRESPDPTADALSDDILTAMHEWRLQHPDASFTEIEQALDQRWYRLRARMLHDLALHRAATLGAGRSCEPSDLPRVWPHAHPSRSEAASPQNPW